MKISQKNNEQGVAHIALAAIVVVVIAVVGFAGWKVSSGSSSNKVSSATKAVSAAAKSACLSTYHDNDLCKFEAQSIAQPIDKTGYTATITSSQSGTDTSMVFKQDGKGNTSLSTTGGDSSTQLNSIQYGGSTYIETNGVWTKYSGASVPTDTTDPSTNLDFLNSLTNTKFTKIGSESCGGLTCLKYQITDNITPNATQYVWFDTKNYLLREWNSTDTSSGTVDMKITYGSVSISAPSPVQDFSATQ